MFRLSERQCPVSGYTRVSQGQALFEGAIICGYKQQLPLRDSPQIKWAVDPLRIGEGPLGPLAFIDLLLPPK